MNYQVLRPPLNKDFELPSREDLLKLKPGDSVRLRFQVGDEMAERLWVELIDCSGDEEWAGKIDNDAEQPETAQVLSDGTEVKFHPLDIVGI